MKLDNRQREILLRALRAMAGYSPQSLAEETDKVIDEIEKGEVHVLSEGGMDRIKATVEELRVNVLGGQKATREYIAHVQKHCVHRFWENVPGSTLVRKTTKACVICGKSKEPASDTLRLMED